MSLLPPFAWMKNQNAKLRALPIFDRTVTTYAAQPGHVLHYETLGNFEHDLDTRLSQSNYCLSNSKQLSIPQILPVLRLSKALKIGQDPFSWKIAGSIQGPKFSKAYRAES